MTYGDLLKKLENMSGQQLLCSVTVEDPYENEFYPAELRIIEKYEDLDENHPVICMT